MYNKVPEITELTVSVLLLLVRQYEFVNLSELQTTSIIKNEDKNLDLLFVKTLSCHAEILS